MCKIIHRIHLPFASGTVMFFVDDSVYDRIAEVHIGIGHIDFGTQYHSTFRNLAGVHFLKQSKTFFNRSVAIRAGRTRLSRCTLLRCNLFACLFINVGFAFFNQTNGKIPKLLKIVRSMINVAPFESQPFNVFLDGFYIFGIFLLGVGIVKSQVADATKFLRSSEVHANSFGMSNVQVAVRFRRESGL